jgi:predicted DNA-binding protein
MSERYTLGPDVDLDQEVVLDKSGRRITEARAEQIAEETLREVRRGRPSLSGEPENSPRVSFRIPEQLRVRIEQQAEREGRPVSEIAREALERYLAQ